MVTGRHGNYTLGQYNVILSAGMTRIPFNVSITNDNTSEINEKFDIIIDVLSLPLNVDVGDVYQATVMILDDDSK